MKMKINIFLIIIYLAITPIIIRPEYNEILYYLFFFGMLFYSIFNYKVIVILFGSSNFFPEVFGYSPMLFIFLFSVAILVMNKKDLIYKNNLFFLLILIFIWLLFSSLINNADIEFSLTYFTGILTAYIFYLINKNNLLDFKTTIFSLLLGLHLSISIGLFTIFKVFGYYSHFFERLSFQRGDPNSLGLTLLFLVIFHFSYSLNYNNEKKFKFQKSSFVLFLVSFFLLISTASKGSFLSAIIAMLFTFITLLIHKYKKGYRKKMRITLDLNLFVMFLVTSTLLVFLFIYIDNVSLFFIETLSKPIERLNFNFKDDSRNTLYAKAFNVLRINPLFGIGNQKFKSLSNGLLSHNTYLDYLINGGVFVFLTYLVIVLLIYFRSFKIRFIEPYLFPFLMSAFALAFNQFTYSSAGDKLIWIPLGILIFIVEKYQMEEKKLREVKYNDRNSNLKLQQLARNV